MYGPSLKEGGGERQAVSVRPSNHISSPPLLLAARSRIDVPRQRASIPLLPVARARRSAGRLWGRSRAGRGSSWREVADAQPDSASGRDPQLGLGDGRRFGRQNWSSTTSPVRQHHAPLSLARFSLCRVCDRPGVVRRRRDARTRPTPTVRPSSSTGSPSVPHPDLPL